MQILTACSIIACNIFSIYFLGGINLFQKLHVKTFTQVIHVNRPYRKATGILKISNIGKNEQVLDDAS